MKRMLVCAATLALLLAAPALAKGPSEATITGPGLEGGGISLKGTGGGDPSSGTPLGDLTEFGGFFPAMFGQDPDPMLKQRPRGDLGPKYTIEYTVPGPNGTTSTIRQDVYPYATPDPVTHTNPGQPFFEADSTNGGWFVGTPDLKNTLVEVGLPSSAPAGSSGDAWLPSWRVMTTIAAALILLALTFAMHRRRFRPAEA